MAFNGTGTFSRLFSWASDKANSVKILASRMDQEFDGIATGLSTAICKDGQTTTTAKVPFALGISLTGGTSTQSAGAALTLSGTNTYASGSTQTHASGSTETYASGAAVTFAPGSTVTVTPTGASARALAAILGDCLNVKNFGATGDGSTDDTATIQLALTAAATTRQAVYFPAGTYKVTGALTVPIVRLFGDGPGNTIIQPTTFTGLDLFVFSNPTGYDQMGAVEDMTIRLSNSNGQYAIKTPRGNFADIAEYRPKWRFHGLSFRSANTASGSDSFNQDYGWTFCIRLGDSWNAEISFIDALGNYDPSTAYGSQYGDGFLQLSAQNGILSCRIHNITTHNVANAVEVVERAYFSMYNCDIARAYRGVYDGSARVYEVNKYAYGETAFSFVVVNAQYRCWDLGYRYAAGWVNCVATRGTGIDTGLVWKGIALLAPHNCSLTNTTVNIGSGFTDASVGIEITGGYSTSMANTALGGSMTASIRLKDDGVTGAVQGCQIVNTTVTGNTTLLFDLSEARSTNIVGVAKSSGFTITTYITYGNDSTRQGTQLFGVDGDLQLQATQPKIMLVDSDGSSTEKRWRLIADSAGLNVQTETDAGAFAANGVLIGRVGTAFNTIELRTSSGGATDYVYLSGSEARTKRCVPFADNTYSLGRGSSRWTEVFAATATINTSDRTVKDELDLTPLGLDFILGLRPVVYKFKDYDSVVQEPADGPDGEPILVPRTIEHRYRRHHEGLIAQEVEALIKSLGREDSAIFTVDNETGLYGLRYEEIVAPLIKAVQELSAKVAALEANP